MSLAQLGRFAEAAAVRSRGDPARRADAACVHRRSGPLRRGHASPPQGRLGEGALTDRARDRGVPDGERRPPASLRGRLLRLGPGAARRGERGAEPAPGRRAAPRASGGEGNRRPSRLGLPLAGSRRSAARPARRGAAPGRPRGRILSVLTPGSRPMRCTCSATSRPIPTGSMPRAARPTTARRWRSPSRAACAPSSPTATSASASSTGARASASRPSEHLTTATTMYREMDMRFWLEQAETEMKESG